jgi:hypothetical protein
VRESLSRELVPYGSEIRIGFEGTYAPVLAELEDLPSQFIGDVRDGRCALVGGILTEETGTNRSSGATEDLEDFGMRGVLKVRVVDVVDIGTGVENASIYECDQLETRE